MNRFSSLEHERSAVDRDHLLAKAHQMHLDGGLGFVPSRLMGEALRRKIPAELSIDPSKKVEVERRRNALPDRRKPPGESKGPS